jgi:uncharacterized membrane protein YgaE (UPF0421/DUF939 family)
MMIGKNSGMNRQLREWVIAKDNPPSLAHVVLTAIAAVVSYLIAQLFRLPEAYWAPMSTLIVMQLTLNAALPVSVQYITGTAVGATAGAMTDIYFHGSVWAFGVAVVIVGLLCVVLRIERSAYRYACITLAIVMLVPRSTSGRLVAIHRFLEVSIGIAVGLVLFAIWQRIDLSDSANASQASSVN